MIIDLSKNPLGVQNKEPKGSGTQRTKKAFHPCPHVYPPLSPTKKGSNQMLLTRVITRVSTQNKPRSGSF